MRLTGKRVRAQDWIMTGMLGASLLQAACGDDDKGPSGSMAALCSAGNLESDLEADGLAGPGVDPATGELQLTPGTSYVVSSTYGIPVPGEDGSPVTQRYLELFTAVQEQLMREPGLLAMRLGSSEGCGSGRTLAIWRSEEEMYDFVTSPAHLAAMGAVNEVLKPGYGVTHWNATSTAQTTWEEAVRHLAAEP